MERERKERKKKEAFIKVVVVDLQNNDKFARNRSTERAKGESVLTESLKAIWTL